MALPVLKDEFFSVTAALTDLCQVVVFQLISRNKLSQLDTAIVTQKFASKWHEKVFESEPMTGISARCSWIGTILE